MANVDAEFALIPREFAPGRPMLLTGKITATPVTADVWRFFTIPAGCRLVDAWIVSNTDGGTDVPGVLSDGVTTTMLADVVFETASTARRNATAGLGTEYTSDAIMKVTIGTVNTGAEMTAVVAALVERL